MRLTIRAYQVEDAPDLPLHPGSGRGSFTEHTAPVGTRWRFRQTVQAPLFCEDGELWMRKPHDVCRLSVQLPFVVDYVRLGDLVLTLDGYDETRVVLAPAPSVEHITHYIVRASTPWRSWIPWKKRREGPLVLDA